MYDFKVIWWGGCILNNKIKMFEARIEDGLVFKKIVDAIKDLVKTCNLDANGTGISLQVHHSYYVRPWTHHM